MLIRLGDNSAFNLVWTEGNEANPITVERTNLDRRVFVETVSSWQAKSPNNTKQSHTERLKDNCKRLEIKIASDYRDVLLLLNETMEILTIDDFDQLPNVARELNQKLARANNTIRELRAELQDNAQPGQEGQDGQNGQEGQENQVVGQNNEQQGQAQNQNRNNLLNNVRTRLANRQTQQENKSDQNYRLRIDKNIPKFSGNESENLDDWLFLVDNFQKMNKPKSDEMLGMVLPLLKGQLQMVKSSMNLNQSLTWADFRTELVNTFLTDTKEKLKN